MLEVTQFSSARWLFCFVFLPLAFFLLFPADFLPTFLLITTPLRWVLKNLGGGCCVIFNYLYNTSASLHVCVVVVPSFAAAATGFVFINGTRCLISSKTFRVFVANFAACCHLTKCFEVMTFEWHASIEIKLCHPWGSSFIRCIYTNKINI